MSFNLAIMPPLMAVHSPHWFCDLLVHVCSCLGNKAISLKTEKGLRYCVVGSKERYIHTEAKAFIVSYSHISTVYVILNHWLGEGTVKWNVEACFWMMVPSYGIKTSLCKLKSTFSNVIIFPYSKVCATSLYIHYQIENKILQNRFF